MVTILLYLNDWQPGDGGELRLFAEKPMEPSAPLGSAGLVKVWESCSWGKTIQGCFILFILDFKWFEHFGYVLIKLQPIFMHERCRRNPQRPRTTRSSRMWLHWVVVWCFSVPGKCGMLCGSPASSAGHWRCGLWLSSPLVREKKRWRIGDHCWAEKRQFVVSGSQAMPLLWSRSLALYPHPDMCLLNIYTVSRYLIVYLSISIYYVHFFLLSLCHHLVSPKNAKSL